MNNAFEFLHNKDIFFINSENRVSGTASDFTYLLEIDPNKEYTHTSLISCSIPKTFYSIQENYNTFILVENSVETTITMPAGNYTRNSFALVLKTKLNATSPNNWVYSITYPNIARTNDTGLYSFSVAGNTSQPSFQVGSYLNKQLGFAVDSTQTFISNSLTSTCVSNLNPENNLIIHSNIVGDRDARLKSILSGGWNSFDHIVYENNNLIATSKRMNISKNNIYSFTLTNTQGNIIDLNGNNFTFAILIF